jgi:hypothetical protein
VAIRGQMNKLQRRDHHCVMPAHQGVLSCNGARRNDQTIDDVIRRPT